MVNNDRCMEEELPLSNSFSASIYPSINIDIVKCIMKNIEAGLTKSYNTLAECASKGD